MEKNGHKSRFSRILPFGAIILGLAACDGLGDLDFDLRNNVGGLDTSQAARSATVERPAPDENGLITYPNYQVVLAKRGETVGEIAGRVGLDPVVLATYNGLRVDDKLGRDEVVAIPPGAKVAGGTTTAPLDVTGIATTALDNAPASGGIRQATPSTPIDGPEPIRHQVARGETAYTIARLYNVSVNSLADWNGLGPDLEVRQGQYLLIPVTKTAELASEAAAVTTPGAGTKTPEPPSASKPLPEPVVKEELPGATASASSSALLAPVTGETLRPYKKRTNEGIDIASPAGTSVKAAGDGEVAAITRDTDQVPILVLRHSGNLLTVYANIADIKVKKGDRVSRGQTIATVAKGNPSFLHFEVREGFESVNPNKYLK